MDAASAKTARTKAKRVLCHKADLFFDETLDGDYGAGDVFHSSCGVTENASQLVPSPKRLKAARNLEEGAATSLPGRHEGQTPVPDSVQPLPHADAAPAQPQWKRVFEGVCALFVPSNSRALPCKARMTKLSANAGTLASHLHQHVTHVLCDDNLSADQILTYLGVKSLPENVIALRHSWVSDCLVHVEHRPYDRFGIVGFPLPGHSMVSSPVPQSSPSTPSQHSLQVKAARVNEVSQDSTRRSASVAPSLSPTVAFRGTAARAFPASTSNAPDELDAIIHQISTDEIGDTEKAMLREAEEEDAAATSNALQTSPQGKGKGHWQSYFKCMHAFPKAAKQTGPNDAIANQLIELSALCEAMPQEQDGWRALSYRRAAGTIRKLPHPITSREEVLKLRDIGSNLADKIQEFLETGTIEKLRMWRAKLAPMLYFMKIYGVGKTQATKWVQQGLVTLDDVLARGNPSKNQKIGIELFDDLQMRIPRAEVDEHKAIVKRAAYKLDPTLQVFVMGSYRRGAPDCGDVDFLVTREGASTTDLWPVFCQLIDSLKGYLTHPLLVSTESDTGKKWQGIGRLPMSSAIHRRIDFLLVPWMERGAALLYFTGNDLFNRSIRLLARKRGLSLSEKGLCEGVMRDRRGLKLTAGIRLDCNTEAEIFDRLQVPYRRPEDRNVG